jgi:hypothetical protein
MTSWDRLTRLFVFFPNKHDICTIVQINKTGQQEKADGHREERLKKQ